MSIKSFSPYMAGAVSMTTVPLLKGHMDMKESKRPFAYLKIKYLPQNGGTQYGKMLNNSSMSAHMKGTNPSI